MTKTTNLISSASQTATNATLRDIKEPLPISSGWEWVLWVLGVLALATLIAFLIFWWLRKKSEVPPKIIVPPHVRARQRLQEALALLAQPKPFVTAVSDALRTYLEERFDFRAPERTTEEFLYELGDTPRLSKRQKESLGEFLQCCDLVKFAKYEPREPELRDLHTSALRLVEETEPPPEPVPGTTAPAPAEPTQPTPPTAVK